MSRENRGVSEGAGAPDRRRLRAALAACAACVLAAGGAAGAAWWYERGAEEELRAAQNRLAAARGRYAALDDERRQWRRFGPAFRDWEARGRIGEERRADWIAAIRGAAARAAATSASHRLGPPRTVQTEGPVEVRSSGMSVELGLPHEGGLTAFLRRLELRAPGLFTVSGCRLVRRADGGGASADGGGARETRDGPAGARTPAAGGIDASCRLQWLTVALHGAPAREDGPEHWPPAARAPAAQSEAAPSPLPLPGAFGRLFTTAAERARRRPATNVEEAAAAIAAESAPGPGGPAPPAPASPRRPAAAPVRVGGVIVRSSGRPVSVWLDGKRVEGGHALPGRGRAEADGTPAVRFDAGGRTVRVRPGQRFDPATGLVTDPIRRTAPLSERDEFLQKSSSSPLTDPRQPG